MESVKLL